MQEFPHSCRDATQVSTPNASDSQVWSDLAGARYRGAAARGEAPTICVIDDDAAIRETIRDVLEDHDYAVECFADGPAFLRAQEYEAGRYNCLLIDALMSGMSGLALLEQLKTSGVAVPAIMMSGGATIEMTVRAMSAGAVDFIQKPFESEGLLATVKTALEHEQAVVRRADFCKAAARRVGSLTKRQHEILDLVVAGHPSKNIAADLNISQRTVENHRAAIARKTCAKSLSALIQTALCGNCSIYAQIQQQPARASPTSRSDEDDILH